jgi:multidrug efflux pump subunit AcrA (membrane-fusion protein)
VATVTTSSATDVLAVPMEAVQTDENGNAYVTKSDGTKVDIEIGRTSGQYTEILSGLNEGDEITYESRFGFGGSDDGSNGSFMPGGMGGGMPGGGMGGGPGGNRPGR